MDGFMLTAMPLTDGIRKLNQTAISVSIIYNRRVVPTARRSIAIGLFYHRATLCVNAVLAVGR